MHRLVIASVTLIGLVAIAVVAGYLVLFAGAGDRAATLAPAATVAYANVYLQPSTGQQANLSGLIGRLPGFADEAALDEKVDQVVQNLLATTGIDYRADVKPWLGDQIAVAAWPNGSDATQASTVILADVSDPDAALSSIAAITADQGLTFTTETYEGVELQVAEGTAYAVVDGMLVVGNGADAVHAVVDTSGGGDSLAAQPAFTDAMDDQPNDYLASFYVDLAALAEASGTTADLGSVTTASAVLVAEPDGLKLSGSAPLSAGSGAAGHGGGAGHPHGLDAGRDPRRGHRLRPARRARDGAFRGGRRAGGRGGDERHRHPSGPGRIRARRRPRRRRAAARRGRDGTCRWRHRCDGDAVRPAAPPPARRRSRHRDARAHRRPDRSQRRKHVDRDARGSRDHHDLGARHDRRRVRGRRRRGRHRPERRRTSPPLRRRAAPGSPSRARARTSRRSTLPASARGPRSSSTSGRSAVC